jgi:phosphatidylglycerol:prolipoprotein diacylglycerol transferase
MSSGLEFYQHIPEKINPEIIHFGFFSLGWYALMYLVGFLVILGLLRKRLGKGEGQVRMTKEQLFDFLILCFIFAVIGGRLGYVLFYNPLFYLAHPLAIISPFDPETGAFMGIYGMSYHGGLIGVLCAVMLFVKKYKIDFWNLSDFVIPAIPAGYFFGRLGNFLNGELYGRVTNSWLGMYFPSSVETQHFVSLQLRHPSQLYEALLEGLVLFAIFWLGRNRKKWQGNFLALYLSSYSAARFFCEFFREPDAQIGFLFNGFTLGQLFSLVLFFCGLILFFTKKKNYATLKAC